MIDRPDVAELLRGAIDLHLHSGPSPLPRKLDHVEATRRAAAVGMRALLMKDHHHPTVFDLLAAREALSETGVATFGSIVLNEWVGGINPSAVQLALGMGARAVWFPTVCAHRHHEFFAQMNYPYPEPAVKLGSPRDVSVWADEGKLSTESLEVLRLIAEHDVIMSPGHGDVEVVDALINAAHEVGVRKIIINHPEGFLGAPFDEVDRWIEKGAYIEQALVLFDDKSPYKAFPFDRLLEWIYKVGPERTILGSDLGQYDAPYPDESFARIIGRLLDAGVTPEAIRLMTATNAATLLGLDPLT